MAIIRRDFKYIFDEERELSLDQLSCAITELNSVLFLLEHSRENKEKFDKYMNYAKELKDGLFKVEIRLKKKLKEKRPTLEL
jgi:hypothetical protein